MNLFEKGGKHYYVRIPPTMVGELVKIAETEDSTLSSVIRQMTYDGLKARERKSKRAVIAAGGKE